MLLAKTDQGTLEQVGKHLQLRSRVYSIAWHPTNEMQLAVGTQDGEVGSMMRYTLVPISLGIEGQFMCRKNIFT